MGDSRVGIDRRGFLGLAAASSAAVATGVVASACQGGPGDTPKAPPASPAGTTPPELYVAPLRIAVVTDDVAPAFTFRPVGRTP